MANLSEEDVRRIATDVYNTLGTRFGVASIPSHIHNGIDTNQIPASSIVEFVPLDSTGTGASATTSGVLAVARAEGQQLNDSTGTKTPAPGVYIKPIPIIYGHGVGAASQFDGGLAPNGSMLIFNNPGVAQQLWWRVADQWWGVDVTNGFGGGADALGPN